MNSLYLKTEHQNARGESSWSFKESVGIRLWRIVWLLLARWTPKKLNPWRLFLLRVFGAEIKGKSFVFSSAEVFVPWNLTLYPKVCLGPRCQIYSLGKVVLHDRVVVSQEAVLCGGTHDLQSPRLPLMVGDIEVFEDVFIGMRAFLLPGVNVGSEAVVGAMAVVSDDVPPHTVVAGNPARKIHERFIQCESVC